MLTGRLVHEAAHLAPGQVILRVPGAPEDSLFVSHEVSLLTSRMKQNRRPLVRGTWSKHMVAQPVRVSVLHDDIKRKVNAQVFPLRCISLARKYVRTVRGALTFGDICPDKGYYMARDGNTPALCSDVMFGRVYFVPENKLNQELSASDLIYDRETCEADAKLFDGKHMPYFYKAACLDIETVFDKSYRDPRLHSRTFAYAFPYCTESRVADMTEYRSKLVCTLNAAGWPYPKGASMYRARSGRDMPGEQHEITCVSLVILNSHVPKGSPGDHRKTLIVLYNKCKVRHEPHPEADHELDRGAGIDQVSRVQFHPCSGELALLEATIRLLYRHGIEQLYVYNAEFDVRVIEQRVHFYAESKYAESADPATRKLCSSLLGAWNGLFVTRALATDVLPTFQDKAKLGHFKMNSCGMNIVDLYRMAGTREIKFACTSMKLNDVAPFVIAMMRTGGKGLFAVLLYNLVDSQLCARLAKVLKPVSVLFHRCRTTLNIDVVVHGRGDHFGGFVQSIHSVQIPQLKFRLDTSESKRGPWVCDSRAACGGSPRSSPSTDTAESSGKGEPCTILSRAYTTPDPEWAWS
ncbi:hypothetical protein KUCAC02_007858 [Chaenocephalus aceratus]|uniref:Uncharacterized protein n=1 Tax=Chaenocephalus aceratus TaxID=36190 RepID=A0ACB9X8T3_CHAAC|nr:hypothetical protein KUCAC02_007858 [Chaenocephalus aceratus]